MSLIGVFMTVFPISNCRLFATETRAVEIVLKLGYPPKHGSSPANLQVGKGAKRSAPRSTFAATTLN